MYTRRKRDSVAGMRGQQLDKLTKTRGMYQMDLYESILGKNEKGPRMGNDSRLMK